MTENPRHGVIYLLIGTLPGASQGSCMSLGQAGSHNAHKGGGQDLHSSPGNIRVPMISSVLVSGKGATFSTTPPALMRLLRAFALMAKV